MGEDFSAVGTLSTDDSEEALVTRRENPARPGGLDPQSSPEPVVKALLASEGRPTRIRHEKTDTVRCIKSCRPNDVTCVLDPVHTISHTVISLPTFREFTRPEEIVFLRAVTPAYPANHADIIFDITEGNLRDSFDIIKRYLDGMTVGVVRQVRPIVGPYYATLKLEMNYVVGGMVSHRNVVNVHIFVSKYWF
ncbi:fibulin-1-like [Gracilinanus agilis]|uniref:fibulin-1-like n=1 Tax=Gracilinanus agilis TaxID=191870 RepID=UPI001CFD3989|nr:fibulin-1-like [Gracilinanus agilis]